MKGSRYIVFKRGRKWYWAPWLEHPGLRAGQGGGRPRRNRLAVSPTWSDSLARAMVPARPTES